jgi:hypothetical protein
MRIANMKQAVNLLGVLQELDTAIMILENNAKSTATTLHCGTSKVIFQSSESFSHELASALSIQRAKIIDNLNYIGVTE